MKKQTLKSIVIGILVGGSVLAVSAYNTQIWAPVQFVKQLFVTSDGSQNSLKATIKIDGTNGRIDAKAIYENGQKVATENYVNSKLKGVATTAYVNSKVKSIKGFTDVCDANHVGRYNSKLQVCKSERVCSRILWMRRCRTVYKWKTMEQFSEIGSIIGRKWHNAKSYRKEDITYTNYHSYPIVISVVTGPAGYYNFCDLEIYVDGNRIVEQHNNNDNLSKSCAGTVVVPPKSTYRVDADGWKSGKILSWYELY